MTDIRVTCRCCGVAVLIPPAGVLLLTEPDGRSGIYLFQCPVCERLAVRSAQAVGVKVLLAAGVRAGGAEDRTTGGRPAPRADARPPFTADDLLDFHQELRDDDWFPRLAGSVRPPLSG